MNTLTLVQPDKKKKSRGTMSFAQQTAIIAPATFWACMGLALAICSVITPWSFYLSLRAMELGNLLSFAALSLVPLLGLGWLFGKVYQPGTAYQPRRYANAALLAHTTLVALTVQAASLGMFLSPDSSLFSVFMAPAMLLDLPITLLCTGGAWALGASAFSMNPIFATLFSLCSLTLGGALWAAIGYALGEWREQYPVQL